MMSKYITNRSIFFCISILLAPCSANAKDIYSLEKGFYLPKDVGCAGIGGAAEIYFDGSNISGHYQLCKTTKLDEKETYKSVCIEAQGPNQPKLEDIEKDPDKTSVIQKIEVKSDRSFSYKNNMYSYCGS